MLFFSSEDKSLGHTLTIFWKQKLTKKALLWQEKKVKLDLWMLCEMLQRKITTRKMQHEKN